MEGPKNGSRIGKSDKKMEGRNDGGGKKKGKRRDSRTYKDGRKGCNGLTHSHFGDAVEQEPTSLTIFSLAFLCSGENSGLSRGGRNNRRAHSRCCSKCFVGSSNPMSLHRLYL